MKQGWEMKKLHEVCSYEKSRNTQKGLPYVGLEHIESNTGRFIGSLLPQDVKSSTFFFNTEHVLYGRLRPYLNKVLVPDFSGHCSTEIFPIKPKDNLYRRFLYFWLIKSDTVKNIDATWTGARMPRANMNEVLNFTIPIPTFNEQKRIVAKLDQAFSAIDQAKANVERNLQNAKDLFQSELNKIFSQKGDGWVEKKLEELGTLTSSKRIYKNEYVAEGIPFYRSKEVKELAHNRDITLELFITTQRYNEIKERFGIPHKGDILLTAVGTIGEMYVVGENEEFYFKDGNIMWLKDFKSLNTFYLKYALTSYVEQLKAMSQGSAYNALTIEKLKKYSVPVPPNDIQGGIVSSLDNLAHETTNLASKYLLQISALDELKKSILQKAFNGELSD